MNEGYKFEDEIFEVGYWTNNSPINPSGFSEQINEGYKFEDENFKVGYWNNNSPWGNPSDFWG